MLGELPGSVWVLGTPAEESAAPNAGGKVHMVRAGIFDDVDAAIMFHPAAETTMTDERSLAARGFEFYFHGKAAHAAGAPDDGINALDAVVAMYNAVSMLRQQVRSDVRIHGIILTGGAAANIIPDYAAIRYRTRSDDADYLKRWSSGSIACAEGAATATGCRLEWNEYMPPYENTVPNRVLMDLMKAQPRSAGARSQRPSGRARRAARPTSATSRGGCQASRRGSRSPRHWTCPATRWSSRRRPAPSSVARRCCNAAKALAMTAIDLLASPRRSAEAKRTFAADMGRAPAD